MVFDMEAVMEIEHTFGKGSKKPVDESAPKRPSSAFFLWANKNRKAVMKDNPDASLGDVGKILGAMWKKCSSSDKASFEVKAAKDLKAYHVKVEKYKKTSHYSKFQMKIMAWKIHQTKKPFNKDTNAPKRNLSAYMLYTASVRNKIMAENPDMAAKEVMQEQGVWWKGLSEKERKPWIEKAAAEKAKYEKKLARYMKTSDYRTWVTARDDYKKDMLEKRNKLMGIKKRYRSDSKPGNAKKQKRSRSRKRSKTPKASKRRSSSRKSSKRRARTPKAPKSKSRSASRKSSKRRAARRSRTPKASKSKSVSRTASRSASRSASRKRSSRRSRTPKAAKRRSSSKSSRSSKSKSRSVSRRRSRKSKSPKRSRKSSRRKARKAKGKKKIKKVEKVIDVSATE